MKPEKADARRAESFAEILEAIGRMWASAQIATEALARLGHAAEEYQEWPDVVLEDILDAEYLGEE